MLAQRFGIAGTPGRLKILVLVVGKHIHPSAGLWPPWGGRFSAGPADAGDDLHICYWSFFLRARFGLCVPVFGFVSKDVRHAIAPISEDHQVAREGVSAVIVGATGMDL